ncbi:hypothetical protein D9M68_845560 [compost metagenome]
MASGSDCRNHCADTPSWTCAASMPPKIAMASVHSTSSGMVTASATTRGRIRRCPCEMPMTSIASSSCVTRMTPICAVIAEPERPATRMAASTGPSSRTIDTPSRRTMKRSAPIICNCCADR